MPPSDIQVRDISAASFNVMTEADLAEHRRRAGARIVLHRGHYWEQVGAPGFYQPVNLLGRLTCEETTRPTPLSWGYRAALTPECAGAANGALPVLRLADLESYDLDRLSSNRRNKLRKCRRLVKIVQLTGPNLLLEQGYEIVLDALARTRHERALSREAYLAETRSHMRENNRCVLAGLIDGRLGGYVDGYVVEGIAYGVSAYYATWALPTCISTGLVFEFAQLCRRIPKVRMLVGGIDAPEDSRLAHFKMDMGFVLDRIPTKWTMNFLARNFLRRQRPHAFY